jgi:hypothetical protein
MSLELFCLRRLQYFSQCSTSERGRLLFSGFFAGSLMLHSDRSGVAG